MPSELINLQHATDTAGAPWEGLTSSQTTKMVMSATSWGVYYTVVPTATAGGLGSGTPSGDVAWAAGGVNVVEKGHNVQGATVAAIKFTDLDNAKTYTIDCYTNNVAGRYTKIRVDGGAYTNGPTGVNHTVNVQFAAVSPTAGEILLEYARDGVSFACYLNAIQITEDATGFTYTVDNATPTVGDTVTTTFTNATETTGKDVALNSQALSFATENINTGTVVVPALHTLGGTGNLYNTALDLDITDNVTTDTKTLTIAPATGYTLITIDASTAFDDNSIFTNGLSPAIATGDIAIWHMLAGTVDSIDDTGLATNASVGAQVQYWIYDLTDGLWGGQTTVTLNAADSGGRLIKSCSNDLINDSIREITG